MKNGIINEWHEFVEVHDCISMNYLPNENHAADDDIEEKDEWDDFKVVNDPSSGKSVPNEGHALI